MAKLNIFGTGRTLQAAIWAACGMAFILFGMDPPFPIAHKLCFNNVTGYDQGVFSGIVENENFLEHMSHPNDSLMGIIVSIYNLGCFTGCVINFMVADKLGRRRAMWVAMVWVIVCFPPNPNY
jgi:MFS family permease